MNTGCEDEKTLEFIHRCDVEWGLKVVWIEAVVHHNERKGCSHRVVDFKTASRKGEPFYEVAKKYGLPNPDFLHCTRELKLNPYLSYLDSIGWKNDCVTAVGIRSDEIDRMSTKKAEKRLWYPLVNLGIDRQAVEDWWDEQPFKLAIPQYEGNCKWCYKKTKRKLVQIARNDPKNFDFPKKLERLQERIPPPSGGKRKIFRKQMTTQDILDLAKDSNVKGYEEENFDYDYEWDGAEGCGDSCELY